MYSARLTPIRPLVYSARLTPLGPQTIKNTAAYIGDWLGALDRDKSLLVNAAASAQKAADWILGKE